MISCARLAKRLNVNARALARLDECRVRSATAAKILDRIVAEFGPSLAV
jgi:hypothetical protein